MMDHLLKRLDDINKTISVLKYDLKTEIKMKEDVEKQIYELCEHIPIRVKEEGDDRAHMECTICKQWIH